MSFKCTGAGRPAGLTAMLVALRCKTILTRAQVCRPQLRMLDGCSDAGGRQLQGELLARQWCEAAGAAAAALLPNVDTQALTKKLVQVAAVAAVCFPDAIQSVMAPIDQNILCQPGWWRRLVGCVTQFAHSDQALLLHPIA